MDTEYTQIVIQGPDQAPETVEEIQAAQQATAQPAIQAALTTTTTTTATTTTATTAAQGIAEAGDSDSDFDFAPLAAAAAPGSEEAHEADEDLDSDSDCTSLSSGEHGDAAMPASVAKPAIPSLNFAALGATQAGADNTGQTEEAALLAPRGDPSTVSASATAAALAAVQTELAASQAAARSAEADARAAAMQQEAVARKAEGLDALAEGSDEDSDEGDEEPAGTPQPVSDGEASEQAAPQAGAAAGAELPPEDPEAAIAAAFDASTAAVIARAEAEAGGAKLELAPVRADIVVPELMAADCTAAVLQRGVVEEERDPRAGWLTRCFRRGLATDSLVTQRRQLLALAKVPYDPTNALQSRIFHTLYKAITGTHLTIPTWTVAGFQNDDPAPDLRATGLLGVLTLLDLCQKHDTFVQARLRPAEGSPQWFPLAITSFNATLYAMQALRWGRLNSAINERGAVWPVLSKLHVAILLEAVERIYSARASGMEVGMAVRAVAQDWAMQEAKLIAKVYAMLERVRTGGIQAEAAAPGAQFT